MVAVAFNGQLEAMASIEDFGIALDRFNRTLKFELWLTIKSGPSICMLRSGKFALLMYLRFDGDSGFVSRGECIADGVATFVLANGQTDDYPRSWCIGVEQCYKALAYFFVNEGTQPNRVSWQTS